MTGVFAVSKRNRASRSMRLQFRKKIENVESFLGLPFLGLLSAFGRLFGIIVGANLGTFSDRVSDWFWGWIFRVFWRVFGRLNL